MTSGSGNYYLLSYQVKIKIFNLHNVFGILRYNGKFSKEQWKSSHKLLIKQYEQQAANTPYNNLIVNCNPLEWTWKNHNSFFRILYLVVNEKCGTHSVKCAKQNEYEEKVYGMSLLQRDRQVTCMFLVVKCNHRRVHSHKLS